jgi:hypothetical protein
MKDDFLRGASLPSRTYQATMTRNVSKNSERVLLVQATELPPVTQRRPVKLCGHCQPELPLETLATLRLVEWKS